MKRNLPNLIMAGVPKAATTSLFTYLSRHPDICVSSIKETQYFLPIRYGTDHLEPIEVYEQYFTHCRDVRYLMEATLGYLYGGRPLAEAIQTVLGDDIRIIFMLRNPIARAFSFFKFEKGELRLDQRLTFDEYIDQCLAIPPSELELRKNNTYWAIGGGMYAKYLPGWYEVFDASQIKVVFQENLASDPTTFLTDICDWLDLEHEQFLQNLDMTTENKSVNYRNRSLQYAALHLNWGLESFWRSNPWLKKQLRSAYYLINGTQHTERISGNTQSRLDEIYQPLNRALAELLSANQVDNLPGWVTKELNQTSEYELLRGKGQMAQNLSVMQKPATHSAFTKNGPIFMIDSVGAQRGMHYYNFPYVAALNRAGLDVRLLSTKETAEHPLRPTAIPTAPAFRGIYGRLPSRFAQVIM